MWFVGGRRVRLMTGGLGIVALGATGLWIASMVVFVGVIVAVPFTTQDKLTFATLGATYVFVWDDGPRLTVIDWGWEPINYQGWGNVLPSITGSNALFRVYRAPMFSGAPPSLHVMFPGWVPVVLLAAWPLASLLIARRRGLECVEDVCVECGYDLRGLTSDACPECGAIIDSK
ncbi:MAG: hypothetical protein AAF823_07620 [Planctomycetota bacterium]